MRILNAKRKRPSHCPGFIQTFGQCLFCAFLLCCAPVFAQSDTLRALPPITIRDARFEQTGFSVWRADSLPLSGAVSLAERLAWENPLAVRANAPGTLATLSARGLGPAHTPVFWHGLNLQSPQNGTVDAALLPLWPGDRVALRYGGQSAALSSGALGGAVMVESPGPALDDSGWHGAAGAAAGSFGRWEGQGALGWSGSGFASEARAVWQRADNDFPFQNTAQIGAPTVRQAGNALEKLDIQLHNRLAVNAKNLVRTAIWQQNVFREIPPAMTEAPAQTWQRDRALRAAATWENDPGPRRRWQHRLAWSDEAIFFRLSGDTDSSRVRTALLGTEYSAAAGRHWRWKAGAAVVWQIARADGYADSARWFRQSRGALYGMGERVFRGGRLSLLLRQEMAWHEAEPRASAPFTWSVGGVFGVLRFHLSRNFLLPTFNDRYWRAWGNPDLKPESGYSGDLGFVFRKKIAPAAGLLTAETTLYGASVDDWILWQPGPDGIFRPGNLRRVWSRGAETALGWQQNRRGWRLTARVGWQFTRTTNAAVYAGEPGVLHKQLPYVPRHAGSVSMRLAKSSFSAAYLHQWTGARFTTTDNAGVLRGFHLGHLFLQYNWKMRRPNQRLTLDFRLENCWNAAYQVIAYRPMPGRNWRAGVQWAF